ncbi:tetratricopeptide repeat protein [Salmonirosea aquatica]|uniref:Tetratricopeptide repeat protein n=1 Tax=Salmonirosea aquatica TaxID=2654236 RepID=A0A7C9BDR2_9BACT|nr:tetratricopeptide repeat protein [Cytophagaceae bacterium SJW1-29]
MPISQVSYIRLLFCLPALLMTLSACQSDARNNTRIPPIPSSLVKTNWQKDAVDALSRLIARRIDLDQSYFKRARIYFDQEKYPEAAADVSQAISLKENVGEYYMLRGKVHREMGQTEKALEDAQRAEVLQQDLPELYVLLADLMQEKKQYRDSQRYLATAMQMAPYQGNAYYVKGMLQSKMADTLAALASLKHALALNPRMLRTYQQISLLNTRLGNHDLALQYNTLALKRFPGNAVLHLERGEIYQNKYQLDSALFSYQQATRRDSSLVRAHFLTGNIWLKWKSYPAAIRAYENVLKYRENFPEASYLMGICYERLGNDDKAAEYYTLEISRNPDDALAAAGIARIQNRKMRKYDPAGLFTSQPDSKVPRLPVPRTLDSSRIKITTIEPRRTLDLGRDTTLKMTIK